MEIGRMVTPDMTRRDVGGHPSLSHRFVAVLSLCYLSGSIRYNPIAMTGPRIYAACFPKVS